MQLRLNGQVLQTWTVTGSYATYTASVALNGCAAPKTQSYTYYDDPTYDPSRWGLSTQIITGAVTMVGQGLWGVSGAPFGTTRWAYDPWGNVISTTDALGRVSTTSYDATYHAFATASCRAVGRPEQLCTTTNVYGVNAATLSGSFGLFGQVQRTYDDNGTDTAVIQVYDAFERVVKVVRPGDSVSIPTEIWEYSDAYSGGGLQGLKVVHALQEVSGQAGANWPAVSFYDGLGRAVQVRTEKTNGATQSVVNTVVDALGRVAQAYTAVEESFSWDFTRPAGWSSRPLTDTAYDAWCPSTRQADGSTTTTCQVGRTTVSVDGNGHRRDSLSDALGRTTGVIEYLGEPQTYQAESLYHQIGTASGGVWLSPAVGGGSAYLTYGPYHAPQAVGAGQVARFRLAIDTAGADEAVAKLDVWDATAGQTLAERTLYRGEFAGGLGAFSEFALVFDTTGRSGHALEYRVLWYDKAQMAHDLTQIAWTGGTTATTEYVYDVLGNLTGVTDALGNVTTMAYDALGRKTSMVDPDMGHWTYTYDLAGNLTGQTDARGCVTGFTYDGLNRLTGKSTTGATGCAQGPVSFGYDQAGYGESLGRRTTMTDTSGSTTWTYDTRGRVTQEVKLIGTQPFTTSTTYDALDRVVTTTYPDGEVVTTAYNAATQPVSLSGSSSYVSSAVYQATGALAQLTLGNGMVTTYTTNSASGRLVGLQVGDKLSLSYAYDRVGNVLRVDEQRGVTFADSFDSKNTAAWVFSAHQTVPYAGWDANNVLKNAGTGTNWDASFYRSSYSLTSGEALQVRFKGDRADTTSVVAIESNDVGVYRRFGVNVHAGKIYVQYNDGAGWVYPQDLIGAFEAGTWYVLRITVDDASGFVVEVVAENDATTYARYTQAMAAGKGWRFRHWTQVGNTYLDAYREWGGTERGAYGYDGLDRLVRAEVDGALGYTQVYTYNAIGNLLGKSDVGTYTYPASGASSVRPHAVTGTSNGGSYGYDANGNMVTRVLSGTTYTLVYDAENRLVQVKQGSTVLASYVYDGDGVLVKKVAGGQTTVYVGAHYEKNLTTGVVTKYYYLGSQRVAMRVGGTLTWIHGDHLGSASLTTNASRAVVGEMRYYPYGETRWTTGTVGTDRRYTGQREEAYTRLYQMGARWYDPVLARWTSPDSIVPDPGNPQNLNRYSYVLGNPVRYTDPDGHSPLAFLIVLAGATTARLGSEYAISRVGWMDRARRDQLGGGLVTDVADVIEREAAAHSVDPVSVGAVLRHESAAVERRALTIWPTSQPGVLANLAEGLQSCLPESWSTVSLHFGDMASLGPGQMQLRRARELEELGYVTPRNGDFERRAALLGRETSVEYVAGMLQYLSDQLSTVQGFSALSLEQQQRLVLTAYNLGWTDYFYAEMTQQRFEYWLQKGGYDRTTLDEYLRWSSGQ